MCVRTHMYNVRLRHSLSDGQHKTANDNYNQHLKAKASYNANIEKTEKEWKGRGQKDLDWILGCLESRAQLSPFISHAYLDMGVWVMAVCNCPLLYTLLLIWSHQTPTPPFLTKAHTEHPPPFFHNKNCIVIPSSWGSSTSRLASSPGPIFMLKLRGRKIGPGSPSAHALAITEKSGNRTPPVFYLYDSRLKNFHFRNVREIRSESRMIANLT